jgi:polysaccharide pyruvyl transferase WcaK-like protein
LTKVDYIALREGRHGPKCLRAWGVPSERWTVTGDDAIELAFDNRSRSIGDCIGVNVRVSEYSAVSDHLACVLREPLQHTANSLGARLRPVPISRLPDEADASQINRLFDGYTAVQLPDRSVDTPLRVIQEIQHCRVVITGSYHAGVFALAQGIPVIGIVGSEYYQWKFEGLAHQFGDGCCILRLATATTPSDLESLIRDLWDRAPTLRPALLNSAEAQRDASQIAYNKMLSVLKPSSEGVQCKLR